MTYPVLIPPPMPRYVKPKLGHQLQRAAEKDANLLLVMRHARRLSRTQLLVLVALIEHQYKNFAHVDPLHKDDLAEQLGISPAMVRIVLNELKPVVVITAVRFRYGFTYNLDLSCLASRPIR